MNVRNELIKIYKNASIVKNDEITETIAHYSEILYILPVISHFLK